MLFPIAFAETDQCPIVQNAALADSRMVFWLMTFAIAEAEASLNRWGIGAVTLVMISKGIPSSLTSRVPEDF
jgi:hypothetical protein